jgi:hypothetical protein
MLDQIIRYLHESLVPFRVASFPSPEPMPNVGYALPPHAMLVEGRLINVDGNLVLACYRSGDNVDLAAFGHALGGAAIDVLPEELPNALINLSDVIPPLGKLFGLPLIVEEAIESCGTIVFRGLGRNDFLEIPYDDFARQEQPRVASFARAGELTYSSAAADAR